MEFSEMDLVEVKEAYRKLYYRSKEFEISSEQQNLLLAKLIEEIYLEKINKLSDEGEIFTDSEKEDILARLRIVTIKWGEEFDKENSKNVFWKKIISKKRYILLFTFVFFCLIGYMENKGYSITNIFVQDYSSNKYVCYIKLFLTCILISVGYNLLVLIYYKVFNLLNNKKSLKNYISNSILIILVYLLLSFIFHCFYFELSDIFPKTIALISMNLLSIFKYIIMFKLSNIIILRNYNLNKFRDYFFSKFNAILIVISIIVTSLFVIIISLFLDNYFGIDMCVNANFLSILQTYKYNLWMSYIFIIYQSFISSILIYKLSNYYYQKEKNRLIK